MEKDGGEGLKEREEERVSKRKQAHPVCRNCGCSWAGTVARNAETQISRRVAGTQILTLSLLPLRVSISRKLEPGAAAENETQVLHCM